MKPCGLQPADLRYAPCTRDAGHDGPCAHPLAEPWRDVERLAEAVGELNGEIHSLRIACAFFAILLMVLLAIIACNLP